VDLSPILSGMDDLAIEAMSLTDGADIHDVAGLVAIYRAMIREHLDATQLERELRSYVVRKRMELFARRKNLTCIASAKG
jgi:hypothetical protein